jgi:flagellar assembly protein FliH
LSKLIKATHNAQVGVMPFDFLKMEPAANAAAAARRKATTAAEVAAASDRLSEIEITIQNRLLDAERKAHELEEEAYRQGYAQGQKDGSEIGQKSMAIVREHLEDLFAGLHRLPEQLLADYRGWIIDTSLAIARHVVGRELAGDKQQLIQLIDSLVREADEGHTLTLYVNPNDLDLLEKHVELKHLEANSGRALHLKADPRLERGGCRMESDIQMLDASIEKQFALIKETMTTQDPTLHAGAS